MNKYLKSINERLKKRFSKLDTRYFQIYESLGKAKVLKTDELSRAFLKLNDDLQKFITIDSIKNYITNVSPIITYEKLNTIMKDDKDIGIVVFDTETTGLIQKSGMNKQGRFQNRNQIYELAAITYNYSLEEAKENDKVDFFHAKVKDSSLNAYNSVKKISDKVKKILNSDLDMEALDKAYKLSTEKNQYNPDRTIFHDNLPAQYKSVADLLIKMMPIEKLRKMTKADKDRFANIFTGEEYMVDFYDSEMAMITNFFKYIEKQKNKFKDGLYILAHNLNYDKGMVMGAIEDSISYWQKNDTPHKEEVRKEMLAKSQDLLIKANNFFSYSIDSLDGFKTLLNEKKYIEKIEKLAKTLKIYKNKKDIPSGEKGFISKLIVRMTKIAKTKNNLYRSTSLGKISPKSINKDWHTALNDVFVTVKTTKIYFTLPMIISIMIKISEEYHKSKTILNFQNIKIPMILIKFAIKNKFHEIYAKIKQEVPEEYDGPFYVKNMNRKTNPLTNLHPDFPGKDDVKITKAETKMTGTSLVKNLETEKDFVGITQELEKAKKNNSFLQLTKEMEKIGIDVSVSDVKKLASENEKEKDLYGTLINLKNENKFDLETEYRMAQKKKQGAQYIAQKLEKKFNIKTNKDEINQILKRLGLKK